jgi:hypothetical protein
MIPGPHPYLRQHLLAHADLGGCLDDDTIPAGFLPWDTSGAARGGVGLPAWDPTRPRIAALAALGPAAEYLTVADRAASMAVLTLPRPPTGSTAAGWADWTIERNVVTRDALSFPFVTRLEATRTQSGRIVTAFADDLYTDVWDVSRPRPIARFPAGEDPTIFAIGAGDADNIWLALQDTSPDSGTVISLWDVELDEPVGEIPDPGAQAMTFCHDGERAVLAIGTRSGSVMLIPVPALGPVRNTELIMPWPVTALAAGSGVGTGGLLAVGGTEPGIVVCDLHTGRPVWRVDGPVLPRQPSLVRSGNGSPPARQLALATSGDEPRLAELRSGVVRLWNPATATLIMEVGGVPDEGLGSGIEFTGVALLDAGGVTQLAFAGTDDGRIWLVDAADGEPTYPPLTTDSRQVTCLAGISGTGGSNGGPLLLSLDTLDALRAWPAGPADMAVRVGPGPDTAVLAFGLDRDGWPVLLEGGPATATVFTADTGELRRLIRTPLIAAGTGGRNHLLAVQLGDGSAQVLDLTAGGSVGPPLRDVSTRLQAAAVSADAAGRPIVLLTDEAGAHLWDMMSGHRGPTITSPAWGAVSAVAAGVDGLVGLGFADNTLRVVDTGDGRVLLEQPDANCNGALAFGAVSGGPRLLAAARYLDTRFGLWDVDTGSCFVVAETLGAISALACGQGRFSGMIAVAGRWGRLVVPWSRLVTRFRGHFI